MEGQNKRTFFIGAADAGSLTNFRGPLIRFLVSQGNRVICSSVEPPEEATGGVRALGAEYVRTGGSRVGTGIAEGLGMIRNYRRIFREIKPDVCFFYMSKPTAFGSPAALLGGVRHFNILVNGLENAYYRKGLKDFAVRCVMSSAYRFACRFADNVFFQNHDDYDFFKSHHILIRDNAKIVGGSGVDTEYFAQQPLSAEPVFLMVARLLYSKGIREYLEAASVIKKKYPQARIMLVGGLDNNDEALTEEELNRYIENSDVEYPGYAADVRPYLAQCSVFVLPSYHEGLPRSVIEAMSCARAIITTDVPGCRETVRDGVNGFLVPRGDSKALAEKMAELIENPGLRASMAAESRRICLERFEVGRVNREMYESMIKNLNEVE